MMEEEYCDFCRWPQNAQHVCRAQYDGWRCTRHYGHAGPHVAYGPYRHLLAQWTDDSPSQGPDSQPAGTTP